MSHPGSGLAPARIHVADYAAIDYAAIDRIARRYTVPGMTPADVRQEAALVALCYAPRHDPGRHPPLPQYLRWRVRRHLSRLCRRPRPVMLPLPADIPEPRPGRRLALAERFRDLAAELLTPRERAALELTAQGAIDSDIATLLGVTPRVVQIYRARGIRKIRARLITTGHEQAQ